MLSSSESRILRFLKKISIKPLLISEETWIGHPYIAGVGLAVSVESQGTEVVQFQSGSRRAGRIITESKNWTKFLESVRELRQVLALLTRGQTYQQKYFCSYS